MTKQSFSSVVLLVFLINTIGCLPNAHANEFALPKPGVMVHTSPEFNPPVLKGIKVHPDNPFKFDFILDPGDSQLGDGVIASEAKQSFLKEESNKLIKYFLASITTPEKDLWVNLSPYEKDRIVPEAFGKTEMGRDVLAQDYLLKQITATLMYPEDEVGKKFWKRIYEESAKRFGTTNVPVNTFNKVWIVPDKAVVYENAKLGTAYVVESHLKVMLESDYLAQSKNDVSLRGTEGDVAIFQKQIIRDIIIPELEKEVNTGKNFAQLRQVHQSLILANWYKKKIKDSILSQVYADRSKIAGVQYKSSVIASAAKQSFSDSDLIYQQYLQAFKKGVYNYIKEEQDPITQQPIPRKYFSGGIVWNAKTDVVDAQTASPAMVAQIKQAVQRIGLISVFAALTMFSDSVTAAQVLPVTNTNAPQAEVSQGSVINQEGKAVFKSFKSPIRSIEQVAIANPEVKKIKDDLMAYLTGMGKKGRLLVEIQGKRGINHEVIEAVEKANEVFQKYKVLMSLGFNDKGIFIKEFYIHQKSPLIPNLYYGIPLQQKEIDEVAVNRANAFNVELVEGTNVGRISVVDINSIELALFMKWLVLSGNASTDSTAHKFYQKQWPGKKDSFDVMRQHAWISVGVHEYEHERGGDEIAAMLSQLILGARPSDEVASIWTMAENANKADSHVIAANKVLDLLMTRSGSPNRTELEGRILGFTELQFRTLAVGVYGTHRQLSFFNPVMMSVATQLKIPTGELLALDQTVAAQSALNTIGVFDSVVSSLKNENPKFNDQIIRAFLTQKAKDLNGSGTITAQEKENFIRLTRQGAQPVMQAFNELQDNVRAYLDNDFYNKARLLSAAGKADQANGKVAEGNQKIQEANRLITLGNQQQEKMVGVISQGIDLFNGLAQKLRLTEQINLNKGPLNDKASIASPDAFGYMLSTEGDSLVAGYFDPSGQSDVFDSAMTADELQAKGLQLNNGDFGLRKGRTNKMLEKEFEEFFTSEGIIVADAEQLANTFLRLKPGSVDLLVTWDVLSVAEGDLIKYGNELRVTKKLKNLASKMKYLTQSYDDYFREIGEDLSDKRRETLLSRLIPVSELRKYVDMGIGINYILEVLDSRFELILQMKEAKDFVDRNREVLNGESFAWKVLLMGSLETAQERLNEILEFVGKNAGKFKGERVNDTGRTAALKYVFSNGLEAARKFVESDLAMLRDLGGIDLSSDKALSVQNDGNGEITFQLTPEQLQQFQNAPGFVPVIINIQPMGSLQEFLGIL